MYTGSTTNRYGTPAPLLAVMHLMIIIHYELEKNMSYSVCLFQQYYHNMKQYQQISVEARLQNCKK
jgi:hypothetical protein